MTDPLIKVDSKTLELMKNVIWEAVKVVANNGESLGGLEQKLKELGAHKAKLEERGGK